MKGLIFYFIILKVFAKCDEYWVKLTSNQPITRGATITFAATLYHGNTLAKGKFEYLWSDDAMPAHTMEITTTNPIVTWNVTFTHDYPPGPYEVQVVVKAFFIFPYEVTSARLRFSITETLNGKILLAQKNITRDTNFISTADPLINSVNLNKTDADYISNATDITTYWFIDCNYYGPTKDGKFSHLFPVSGEEHIIDALMIADFSPPPVTTTAIPNVTTTTFSPNVTTTSLPNITTTHTPNVNKNTKVQLSSSTSFETIGKVSQMNVTENHKQDIKMYVNGTLVPYIGNFPYICNGTIAVDEKKSYGYFSRKIIAKAPISNVNVTGNNWLQQGDIMTLNVACDGAPSLKYCVYFKRGSYNATGNETCSSYINLGTCSFLIQRYLGESMEHAVIIIIENDITKVVKSVAVTVYKVKKQAQLSVIVVPVAFSLAAIVLIIFGVAYYIQNRKRFIVEVADFNFGVDYGNMEYKTFGERLQDSFMNVFTRTPIPETSESTVWPPNQTQKYGSMT